MTDKPDICLTMIVRNEAQHIQRCLKSALPYCRQAVICDTGSSDSTVEVIADLMDFEFPNKITIYRDEWKEFALNRNLALSGARKAGAKWALLLDGDEELVVSDPNWTKQLDCAIEGFNVKHGEGFHWYVPRLVKLVDIPWKYTGACHEYISAEGVNVPDLPRLQGVHIRHLEDGSRSEAKIQRNLDLLLKEIESEPNNPRTSFYLANTYWDKCEYGKASAWYQRRIDLGGWVEETFYAYYRLAQCYDKQGHEGCVSHYLKAYDFRPGRAEPLLQLARWHRRRNEFHAGYYATHIASRIPIPGDLLFVDAQAYEWDIPLEHGIACLSTNRIREAINALAPLTGKPGPDHLRAGAMHNFKLALSKLN